MQAVTERKVNLYQEYLREFGLAGFAGGNPAWIFVSAGLTVLAVLLVIGLYGIQSHTVRIYNWNGKRYCYLGRAGFHRGKDGYHMCIGERIADLSYTTLYQICPAKGFVRRNRYKNMMIQAGDERCMMHIEERMRKSVYYRKALSCPGMKL